MQSDLLQNPLWRELDHRHRTLFVVLHASNSLLEKANATAVWKISSHHMNCEESHKWRVETHVQVQISSDFSLFCC